MSEVHDNSSVDFEGLAGHGVGSKTAEEPSILKQLWTGLLDDLTVPKNTKPAA